jgi:hypothetical protein
VNDVTVGSVDSGGEIEKKIRDMCKKFFELNARCCDDDAAMAAFKKNPHKVLVEEVGMKIPEEVAIVLNTTNKRWPTLYCMTDEGMVAVSEDSMGAYMIDSLPSTPDERVQVKPFAEIDITIHDVIKIGGVKAVLELPFFDVRSDPLMNIKLDETADILLMTC